MKQVEGVFRGYRETDLYYQCWLPDGAPRAVLLVVHGLAEHSGRYTGLAEYFTGRGYLLCSYDQRGHGKSPGRRGYVPAFSCFTEDLDRFVGFIRQKYPGLRLFLVAHSVGGTVATAYIIGHQKGIAGLVLSGATLQPGASVPPVFITLAPLLSFLIPGVGLYSIDATATSRDPAVVAAYVSDPLVYRGKISTRLGVELLKTMRSLSTGFPQIRLPILILQGTADRLSNPAGSRILFEKISSSDKTQQQYDGFYHEIFNEPGNERVFKDLENWLSARIQ